jgi:hypothetical protein
MSNALVRRDANGHLLPGSRLNPGGRPRGVIEDVRERLGPYTPEFVAALVELVRSPNEAIRVAAIREAFDRLLGKPPVAVAVDNSVEHSIQQLYLTAFGNQGWMRRLRLSATAPLSGDCSSLIPLADSTAPLHHKSHQRVPCWHPKSLPGLFEQVRRADYRGFNGLASFELPTPRAACQWPSHGLVLPARH